jgi:alpha-tubulin suppressor-like RCC1 family protein
MHKSLLVWLVSWLLASCTAITALAQDLSLPELTDVRQLSAGTEHVCARLGSGTVACWGTGHMADATSPSRYSAAYEIRGLSDIAVMTAGADGGCAATITNRIYCWNRSSSTRTLPQNGFVGVLKEKILQLRAYGGNGCALSEGGSVYCWINQASYTESDGLAELQDQLDQPILLPGKAVSIAVGVSSNCVVLADGRVFCWGNFPFNGVIDAPQRIPELTNAASVAGGATHFCSLSKIGTVQCWGDSNNDGRLGRGEAARFSVPPATWKQPAEVVGLTDQVLRLSVGESTSCAEQANGEVRCWGDSTNARLGIAQTFASASKMAFTTDGVAELVLTKSATCALRRNGGVNCLGGVFGIGDGIAERGYSTPRTVLGVSGETIQKISLGSLICAITNVGAVRCNGTNAERTSTILQQPFLGLTGDVSEASVTTRSVCVVRSAQRTLLCLDSTTNTFVPIPGLPAGIANIYHAPYDSLQNSCVVTLDGRVYCLPLGIFNTRGLEQIALSDITAVTIGVDHTCALNRSGQVFCWGKNYRGQLGNGSKIDSNTPVLTSAMPAPAIAIAAAYTSTCAILQTGGFFCWGSSLVERSGDDILIPTSFGQFVGATALVSSANHMCLLISGAVRCLGLNDVGQLGVQTQDTDRRALALPIQFTASVRQVAVGVNTTCALISSGQVQCVGARGQLADGESTTTNFEPFVSTWSPVRRLIPITVPTSVSATTIEVGRIVSISLPLRLPLPKEQRGRVVVNAYLNNASIQTYTGETDGTLISFRLLPSQLGKLDIDVFYNDDPFNPPVKFTPPISITVVKQRQRLAVGTTPPRELDQLGYEIPFTSSSGLTVTRTSLTPSICVADQSRYIRAFRIGTCSILGSQPGNSLVEPAQSIRADFLITPGRQFISRPNTASSISVGTRYSVFTSVSSGLTVSAESLTPTICSTSGAGEIVIQALSSGSCRIRLVQLGNADWLAASPVELSLTVAGTAATLTTLQSSANPAAKPDTTFRLTANITSTTGAALSGFVQFMLVPPNGRGATTICGNVRVVNGLATCVPNLYFIPEGTYDIVAQYSGDAANPPAQARISQTISPELTIKLNTLDRPIYAGDIYRAVATIKTEYPLSAGVRFALDGITIAGCEAVTVIAGDVLTDNFASCNVPLNSAGTKALTATYLISASTTSRTVSTNIVVSENGPKRYADMWWAGQEENGWGLSIQQNDKTMFVVIFVYDTAGRPTWYVLPGGQWNSTFTRYSGLIYQPRSASYRSYYGSQFQPGAPVGNVTLSFDTRDTATLEYEIAGTKGNKKIKRQVFDTSPATPWRAVGDMWWGGMQQNGWGLNISQQGKSLFAVWYTYGDNGRPTWFVMPGGSWIQSTFSGEIYQTTGSPWLGVTYDPSKLMVNQLGTFSIDFRDVGAVWQPNIRSVSPISIERQPF